MRIDIPKETILAVAGLLSQQRTFTAFQEGAAINSFLTEVNRGLEAAERRVEPLQRHRNRPESNADYDDLPAPEAPPGYREPRGYSRKDVRDEVRQRMESPRPRPMPREPPREPIEEPEASNSGEELPPEFDSESF